MRNLVLRSFSFDLAGPSQEIAAIASHLAGVNDTSGNDVKQIIQSIVDKAEQINKVAARLPQYLEDAVPTTESAPSHPPKIPEENERRLVSYLSADRVLFFQDGISKQEIIANLLCTLKLPNLDEARQMVEEREEVGGILIKPNVAIPHSSLPGIAGVRAAFGIQKKKDGPFFWLVFVSGADSIKEHLAFLKATALSLTDEVLESLAACESSEKAMRILGQTSL